MSAPASQQDHADLFLGFFYLLRARGLGVSPTEWLALIEGLIKGLHGSSLIGFYSLARSLLVKDEALFDDFDSAFAEYFSGIEGMTELPELEAEIFRWLENSLPPYPVDPAMRRLLDAVDVEKLRRLFEQRLREQNERHDGGNHWIGTGGTSPFGHSGYHPGGIRVGGRGRLGSAVQVAAARRFREHRKDRVLDTRQLSVALRKLRNLKREGPAAELDLPGTIAATARDAGELRLVFQAPRRNDLKLLLLLDVGGSMEPYRLLVDRLFSAVHAARHFRWFEHLYFHNCIYGELYRDAYFSEPVSTTALLRQLEADTRLVVVGDAYMYPGELTERYGAINWEDRNEIPGIVWLQRLTERFSQSAWINPLSRRIWHAPSISMIRRLFPMYELTIAGIEQVADDLRGCGS